MKELQDVVKKLKNVYNYYATLIDNNGQLTVHPNDHLLIKQWLAELVLLVRPYSENLSQNINVISQTLFVYSMPMIIGLNVFKFGALGVLLNYLQSKDFIGNYSKYLITPWADINEAVEKLLVDSSNAESRLSYNQVGVICREIYIILAQKVYNPQIHNSDNRIIGSIDAKRMFDAYIDYTVGDKKLKEYAKSAIALAEPVTHAKSENKVKMDTLVVALISLVGIINTIFKGDTND